MNGTTREVFLAGGQLCILTGGGGGYTRLHMVGEAAETSHVHK